MSDTPINIRLHAVNGGGIEPGYRIKISSTGFLGGGIEQQHTVDSRGYVQLPGEWRGRDITSLWCYDTRGNLKYQLAGSAYVRRDGTDPVDVKVTQA